MPFRLLAASELSQFLGAIAHPRRIQIIEELCQGERDVGSLQRLLGISHSNVSQHLAILRGLRAVAERREGRQVFYRLSHHDLAGWLVSGLQFLPAAGLEAEQVQQALEQARTAWSPTPETRTPNQP